MWAGIGRFLAARKECEADGPVSRTQGGRRSGMDGEHWRMGRGLGIVAIRRRWGEVTASVQAAVVIPRWCGWNVPGGIQPRGRHLALPAELIFFEPQFIVGLTGLKSVFRYHKEKPPRCLR